MDADFVLTAEFVDYLPDAPAEAPDEFAFAPVDLAAAPVEFIEPEFVGVVEEVAEPLIVPEIDAELQALMDMTADGYTGTWYYQGSAWAFVPDEVVG